MRSVIKRIRKIPFFSQLLLTLLLCAVLLTVGITILTYALVIDLFKNELGVSYIERIKSAGNMLNAWEEETIRNALTITRASNRLLDEIQQTEDVMTGELIDYSTVGRLMAISALLEETIRISDLYSSITIMYENFNYLLKNNYVIRNDNTESIKKYNTSIANNEYWITGETGGHSLNYIYPIITYSLHTRGVIIFTINENGLSRLINGNTNDNTASVFIMDPQGTVISDPNKSTLGKNMLSVPAIASIYSGSSREGHFISRINGTEFFVVYWVSGLNNWRYCSFISMNEINLKTNAISLLIGIAAVVFFFAAAIVSYLVAKRLNIPIKRMEFTLEEYELIRLLSKNSGEANNANWNIRDFFMHLWFCCIVLNPDKNFGHYDENEVLVSALKTMPADYLCRGLCFERDYIVIILNSDSFDNGIIKNAFTQVQEQFQRQYGLTLSAGMGKVTSFDEIAISYNTARRALLNRVMTGLGCLEFFREEPNATENYFYPIDQENIIFNNLRLGLGSKIPDAVGNFFYEIKNRENLPVDNVILTFNQLMDSIIRYLIEKHIDIRKIFDADINFYYKLFESEFIDNIELKFLEIFGHIVDFESFRNRESQKPIDKILAYIHTNLNRTFDITALSDNLGMSYSQARRIFSQEMDDNILNYVYKLKIEEANRLLSATSMSVEDIAKNTGFYNRQSFYHFYKKFEGITPNEFRQINNPSP